MDPYQLERFVTAQDGTYDVALRELKRGAKLSHWMWFIFPQVAGLGSSSKAEFYAIKSRQEGVAYLAHPILGPRLVGCANALLQVAGRRAEEIVGHPDDMKLKSSMTLFAALSASESPFHAVLNRYFAGVGDPRTTEYLVAHESE